MIILELIQKKNNMCAAMVAEKLSHRLAITINMLLKFIRKLNNFRADSVKDSFQRNIISLNTKIQKEQD